MNEKPRPSAAVWRRSAANLLDQQLWLFGFDIRRAEGNLLVQFGCTRIAAPEGSDCSSCYQAVSRTGKRLTLRGFGVLCDAPIDSHAVFLNREAFAVSLHAGKSGELPWRPDQVRGGVGLPAAARDRTVPLVQSIARWISDYEQNVLGQIGGAYRQHALGERDKPVEASPDELPGRWQQIASDLEKWPDLLAGTRQRRKPRRRRPAKALTPR